VGKLEKIFYRIALTPKHDEALSLISETYRKLNYLELNNERAAVLLIAISIRMLLNPSATKEHRQGTPKTKEEIIEFINYCITMHHSKQN
jgi:hypothetical protein